MGRPDGSVETRKFAASHENRISAKELGKRYDTYDPSFPRDESERETSRGENVRLATRVLYFPPVISCTVNSEIHTRARVCLAVSLVSPRHFKRRYLKTSRVKTLERTLV